MFRSHFNSQNTHSQFCNSHFTRARMRTTLIRRQTVTDRRSKTKPLPGRRCLLRWLVRFISLLHARRCRQCCVMTTDRHPASHPCYRLLALSTVQQWRASRQSLDALPQMLHNIVLPPNGMIKLYDFQYVIFSICKIPNYSNIFQNTLIVLLRNWHFKWLRIMKHGFCIQQAKKIILQCAQHIPLYCL